MALLKFLKGNYSSLSTAAIAEGQILICGDTGEMFVDVAADKRVKIGDYVTVANLDALFAIDATSVPTSRLYYVEGANILARSNGATWDQINKDTGATSIEVVGEGNAVTTASYDAITRKLTLTKGASFADKAITEAAIDDLEAADAAILAKIGTVADDKTVVGLIEAAQTAADNAQGEVDALEALVGVVPEGSDNVIAYVNKKAQEVLDAATGGSSESAASVKLALDNYIALNDPKVEANTTAAANAQAKADEAFELAGTKATMDEVNEAIADAGHAVAADVNAAIDDINDKIGDVAEGKTVVEMIADAQSEATYDDEEVRGLIDTNAQAIAQEVSDREGAVSGLKSDLEGKINTKVEQDAYNTKVAALDDEDERLAGLIGDNAEAIEGVVAKVDTLVGEDVNKSVRTIANEELAAQLIAENAAEALNSLEEIAAWIQAHPGDAATMNADIAALKAKVDTGEQTVSAYVAAAIEDLGIGDYATVAALGEAVERIGDLEEASATHALKTEVGAVSDALDEYKEAHKNDYDNDAVDAKVKAVQDQIDVLGDTYATDAELTSAMEAEVERANGAYAAKVATETHIDDTDIHVTTEDKTKWNGAQAAAEATAATNLATARTEITAEIATAKGEAIADAEGKIATAKAEAISDAEGKIATAKGEAIADAEGKIAAAKEDLQGKIDTVSGALNTYKTENDAVVALKADASAVYTKDEVVAMLTWGEF